VALAAVGPLMTKVAAESADALLCHAFTTGRYLREVTVPMVEETLAANGRDRSKFEIVATMFTAAGDTDEEVQKARTRLRQQVSFYGSTPAYKGVFELHGWYDLQPKLNRDGRIAARGGGRRLRDFGNAGTGRRRDEGDVRRQDRPHLARLRGQRPRPAEGADPAHPGGLAAG
jgi:alkanesulfonate monooxygenase SsuD/methylene tetrahydromethanopterin reductase-like flavin-dependent oxidoreductase (luciferase family)